MPYFYAVRKYHLIIWLGLFLLPLTLVGQGGWKETYNQEFTIVPSFSLNNDFNADDWYTGFSGGVEDIGYQWGARLGFQFRPFRKKIQIIESDNLIRQYLERKYLIFLDLDKRFAHFGIKNAHIQFYAGARGGFLMGNYSGTRNDAENHWVAAPFAGVCVNIEDNVFVKVGYMHFADHLLNVDDGRVNFSLVFNLAPM